MIRGSASPSPSGRLPRRAEWAAWPHCPRSRFDRCPVCSGLTTHSELFFADRTNQVGCLDLRTGKLLYSYSTVGATAHALLPLPASPAGSDGSNVGLASIWSDATLRLHSVREPRAESAKGNSNGSKAEILGMLGGVGVGGFVFRGWGTMPVEERTGDGDEAGKGDEEDEDEEVWEGMDDVEVDDEDGEEDSADGEGGTDEEDAEESDEDPEPAPPKKRRR